MNKFESNYQRAVRLVREYLVLHYLSEISHRASSGNFNALDLAAKFGSNHEQLIGFTEILIESELEHYLREADTNRNYFDNLLFYAGYILSEKETMPADLMEFVASYLKGDKKPPKRLGGKAKANQQEEIHKATCIKVAVLQGLRATKNAASEDNSACDAVEQAAKQLYLTGYGYSTLSKIWAKSDKTFRMPTDCIKTAYSFSSDAARDLAEFHRLNPR